MWTANLTSPIATHTFIAQNGEIEYVFPDRFWAYNLGVTGDKTPRTRSALSKQGISNPGSNALNKRTLSVELTALGYIQKVGNKWMQDSNNYTKKVKSGEIKLSTPYQLKDGEVSKNAYNGVSGIYTHNSFKVEKSDIMPQKELLELLYNGKVPSSIQHANLT